LNTEKFTNRYGITICKVLENSKLKMALCYYIALWLPRAVAATEVSVLPVAGRISQKAVGVITIWLLVGKPDEKGPLGRHRR
jgi:hypothetical protein